MHYIIYINTFSNPISNNKVEKLYNNSSLKTEYMATQP